MLDVLIRFALSHRLLVTTLAALLTVYGSLIISKMPIDVFPDLNRPTVTLMTEGHGMSPEEVESLISLPLERSLNGIPGVQKVRSVSGIGLSVISVEFDWGTDIFRNRQLVAEKMVQAQESLPNEATPVMTPISSIMGEIQLIGLSSPEGKVSPMDLRSIADWEIRPQLLSIPGVSQVTVIGGEVKQYQILLSASKLQHYRISLNDLQEKLGNLGNNTAGGFIESQGKEYLIRNLARVSSKEDILNTVVGDHFGQPIFVKDVAEVQFGPQVKRGDGSVNGRPGVILSLQKQPGVNTVELTKKVEGVLLELEEKLSHSHSKEIKLHKDLFKQSHFIETSIHNVMEALRDGSILVVLVLFIFLLNFRTTFITLTAIPLSFVLTAIIMRFFDININTMTLGGLAIAIGELVDDAIIDVENVFRRLKENRQKGNPLPPLKVIFLASSEVRNSIVFATIIVVLVFIPLFYLGGIEGRLFIPLGVAYIISLLCSLFVSLTITPVLCSFLLSKGKLMEKEEGALIRWLKKADTKLLNWGFKHSGLVLGGTVFLFIGALALLPFMGKNFLPTFNEGTSTISLLAVPGTSLEKSNELGTQAEKLLLSIPQIKSVARRTGRAELDEHAEGVHSSEIDVDFHAGDYSKEQVLEEMREKLAVIPDVFINLGQPISHRLDHLLSGVRAQIAIKVFGPDLKELRRIAQDIFENLQGAQGAQGVQGLVDLQIEQQTLIPQVKIKFFRDLAAEYQLEVGGLAKDLEMALNGQVVSKIQDQQKTFDVVMKFDDSSRSTIENIQNTTIKIMPDGKKISLGMVADVYTSSGPNVVNRENSQRRIVVSANSSGRDLDSLVKEIQERISKNLHLPAGYYLNYGGQFESQQQASQMILILGSFSLLGIFLVLFGHFKSIFISLQIMLNIPLAFIGGISAIYLSDRILSVATLVAFITLCGIASRNGIMMISHYLHILQYEGEKFSKDMVIRGSLERLVPVLMTAFTAILALIPLVLSQGQPGKEILHPVAVVIVGGLLSSTLLDMIITPVVFYRFGEKSALRYLKLTQQKDFLKEG